MDSVKYQTGSKYELWIKEPEDKKLEIGIRLKEGTFDSRTNYAAVLMNQTQIKLLINDLQNRLELMEN